jgi:hypothetical protein
LAGFDSVLAAERNLFDIFLELFVTAFLDNIELAVFDFRLQAARGESAANATFFALCEMLIKPPGPTTRR